MIKVVLGNLNSISSATFTKKLGKLKYFLEIEIAQSNSDVVMSQRKYVLDIVENHRIFLEYPLVYSLGYS